MFLPTYFIFFSFLSLGRGQFFYNYEDDTNDHQVEPASRQNDFSSLNERPVPEERQSRNSQDESQSLRTQTSPGVTYTQPSGYSEEAQTSRNEGQRPKIRKYRRVLREGTYIQPPQPPVVYRPSPFENIKLGEAPTGVYIPQDSFLNVLKDSRYNRIQSSPIQSFPNVPAYSGNYQNTNNEPQYKFYVDPPSNQATNYQPNVATPQIQTNVQHISNSPTSISSQYNGNESNQRISNRQEVQTRRQRRPRQRVRADVLPEPVVDIDALRPDARPYPDAIPYEPQPSPQVHQTTQPRSVRRNSRRRTAAQNYQEPEQSPRVYSPSVFQNIGLGEAPNGVHIPQDSLLNVLRDPSRTHTSPRNVRLPPQAPQRADTYPQSDFQPADDESESFYNSRRRLRQNPRSEATARQNLNSRVEYLPNTAEPLDAVPAVPSQEQRRRMSRVNRISRVNQPEMQQTSRREQPRSVSRQTEAAPSRRQQPRNYKPAKLAIAALPEDTDGDEIPGEATVDYPTFHTIPKTAFSCADHQADGYYADMDTSCQVVHLCHSRGVQSSFLCPNGTIFNQEKFSCQWWYKVNCANTPKFYDLNDNLYKVPNKDE